MLKLKTRLISVIIAIAVVVISVLPVSAADKIEDWAQPYTLGTKINSSVTKVYDGNTYSFTLGVKTSVNVNVVMQASGRNHFVADNVFYELINSNGSVVTPLNYTSTLDDISEKSFHSSYSGKVANATIKYYNLDPGKYYFALRSGLSNNRNFSLTITAENNAAQQPTPQPQPTQPAPPPIQPAFVAGSVAPNVTASQSASAINVNWGAVHSAKYAVYYTYLNHTSGRYGDWTVLAVDYTNYTIQNPVPNSTYYITILPFSDNPRVYGGFSPYTQVRT